MEKQIKDILPPPEVAGTLEPEELAIFVLECLREEERAGRPPNRHNFTTRPHLGEWAGDRYPELSQCVMEAWVWLEREGMIAPIPGDVYGHFFFVTRRGHRLQSESDLQRYQWIQLLPKERLDPVLAEKVIHVFLRGDYDTAVFQAFKEVEVRIRSAAELPQSVVGRELITAAFKPEGGCLTDSAQPTAEREAAFFLFMGTYGLFRNPSAHRDVNLNEPMEAAELILLANHLLRIVDRRSAPEEGGT